MKKVLILLCLFGLSASAIQTYSVSGSNTVKTEDVYNYSVQLDFKNLSVSSGNSIEATFGYIGDSASFVIPKPISSSGDYTSATIAWKQYPSSGTIEDNAVVITTTILAVDVFLTDFLTSLFTVSLLNPVPVTINVTASMILK